MEAAAHAKTPAGYGGVSREGARKFLSDDAEGRLDDVLAKLDAGGVRIIYNKVLGGWYVVKGPHDTPISGRFGSKEEAQASLSKKDALSERLDAWFSNKDREAVKTTLSNAAEAIAKKMNG